MSPKTNFPVVPVREVPLQPADADAATCRPLVLVVGAQSAAAEELAETLAQHGFAAVTAYDAPDAIETALIMPPELLIADVELPGITGIELAAAVKDVFPDCQAILLSAQSTVPPLSDSPQLAEEAFVFLDKSARPEDLVARVAETLKRQSKGRRAAALHK